MLDALRLNFCYVGAAGEPARLLWKVISSPAVPDAEALVVAAPAPADGRKRPLLVLPHGKEMVNASGTARRTLTDLRNDRAECPPTDRWTALSHAVRVLAVCRWLFLARLCLPIPYVR